MNIVYIADKNYCDYLVISLFSLLKNNRPEKIFVLIDFENKRFNKRIAKFCRQNRTLIEVIQIEKKRIESLIPSAILTTKNTHATIANYYRLFLSDYMPSTIDKLIYIDCDTIVNGSMIDLWNSNIEEFYFGAVRDSGVNYSSYLRSFNLTSTTYFNSGLLLINLKKIRNEKFTNRCIDFINLKFDRINYWDQDVINIVANNKIRELNYRYNFQAFCFDLKMKSEPIVIHFTGNGNKPLQKSQVRNTYEALFWYYARQCGYNKLYNYLKVKLFFYKVYKKKISLKELLSGHHKITRKDIVQKQNDYLDFIKNANGEFIVESGPFSGLKYIKPQSFGSSITPKLLGVYESELHSVINKIKARNYEKIIDIGCAEGYYAIGFAKMFPNAKILAADIDIKALDFCKEMAIDNKVMPQMTFLENISHSWLETEIRNNEKCLIFCDCEGYEKRLFSVFNIQNFLEADLIIEIHSFLDRSIATYLISVFQDTHNITFITSISDDFKALCFKNPKFENFSFEQRKNIVAENRPEVMEWIYLEPLLE